MYLYSALWQAFGGRDNPTFDTLCVLVEQSEKAQQDAIATPDTLRLFEFLFGPGMGFDMQDEETTDIRRGDTVRLSDGKTARVVSTKGGYIFTTEGTYGSWQVVKVAKA